MDAEQKKKDNLRALLHGKIKGMNIKRMNETQKQSLYEKECKKAGVDPEQLMKAMKK